MAEVKDPRIFFDDSFVPKHLADEIMKRYHFAAMEDTGEIYVYDNGVYRSNGEALIKKETQAILGELCKNHYVMEVVETIRRETFINRERSTQPVNFVNIKNGVLDLETGELRPHNPEMFFLNQLPIEYDPSAKCPQVDKFLSEILKEHDVKIIHELFGYCLYRGYSIHKALLFVGDGANGKSTLINLLKAFLCIQNVAGHSLQEFEYNRFAKADLYGKLANLYPDLPDIALEKTGVFKMLTGGDPITAERKFRDFFNFTNYAKLVFSANKVPEVKDESSAFFRRWIIINFPNVFEGKDADTKKLEKITTPQELSGLLNKALAALKTLLAQGAFSYSKTTEEIREEYTRKSSPVAAFVTDCLIIAPAKWVEKKILYAEFCDYCRKRNYPTVSEDTFHRKLIQQVRVEDHRPKVGEKRPKAWLGIKLNKPIEGLYDTLDLAPDHVNHVNLFSHFKTNIPPCDVKIRKMVDKGDKADAIKVRFLKDIDTGDVSLPNQPIFERVLGPDKAFKAGDVIELDPKDAEILEGLGAVVEVIIIQG
jgi:putative DNA primase/helicase